MITYKIAPPVSDTELNELFATAWENYLPGTFERVLERSLTYICAFDESVLPHGVLVGFVNVAWNGGIHAFILDTTVHGSYKRRGIGRALVEEACMVVKARGIEWVHVDFEPHLTDFYRACGFRSTEAGLRNLRDG